MSSLTAQTVTRISAHCLQRGDVIVDRFTRTYGECEGRDDVQLATVTTVDLGATRSTTTIVVIVDVVTVYADGDIRRSTSPRFIGRAALLDVIRPDRY